MAKRFWRCPEFKNRKAVGDLEKKMIFLKQKGGSTVFNFCASRGGDGVSTIVVNLVNYISKAKSEKRILLVDANFQRPVLHNAFDAQLANGLTEVLKGAPPWSEAVLDTQFDNVNFLTCGSGYTTVAGNLDQDKLASLFEEVKGMYDYVIVDSSPLLTSADSLTVASAADATFLVVQSVNTPKEVGERAKILLHDNECLIGGVLLNRVKQVIPGWMYRLL